MTLVQKGNPEQAHLTHQNQKTRDKHNYRQTTKEKKNTIKKKNNNHKENVRLSTYYLHS